jgi:multiple sugar transport system permease protein
VSAPQVRAARRSRGVLEPRTPTRVVVTTILVLLVGAFLLPLLWSVSTALKPLTLIFKYPPRLLEDQVLWSNFVTIWSDYPLTRWLVNSFVICAVVVVAQVLTSSMSGFAFAKLRFRYRDQLFFLYLAGLLIPSQVLLIPIFQIVRYLGLIDSPLAIIIPALAGPFGTFLFRQFFLSVSDEYIDAARVDGAPLLRIYWSIFLPMARGLIVGFSVITFMAMWNSFLWPLVVLRTPSTYTATLGLSTIAGGEPFRVPWNVVMATGLTFMVPVLALFVLAQRRLVEGLSMSGYGDK